MSFVMLGFLLIFASFSDASNARTISYICPDGNTPLPPCNFEAERKMVRNMPLLNMRDDNGNKILQNSRVVIIFKLIGCVPSELSFSLPKCKTEDYWQRERVTVTPYKFSEDATIQGWDYIKNNRNHLSTVDQLHHSSSDEIAKNSLVKLMKKKNMLYPLLESSYYWNEKDARESIKNNQRRSLSDNINLGIEFPYNEAIPFDPEKHWMLLHHHHENIQHEGDMSIGSRILDDEHGADISTVLKRRRLIEFPYAKAIPFDPKKHNVLLNHLQDHHEVPFGPLNLLRFKELTNSDVEYLMDSSMSDNVNKFRNNRHVSCELFTIRKKRVVENKRKIDLND